MISRHFNSIFKDNLTSYCVSILNKNPFHKMGLEDDCSLKENYAEEDIFKILVATDIHLGYAENNSIRGDDSFITFEEILQIAVRENVDFLLLGGDLFHETRPTPYCIYKCTELLRKYCLGDKPVQIEILSDQEINFHCNRHVNFEDENLNVSLPVFSIHGNHDDPTGNKHISAMDLMATTGLVNYFGRNNSLENVEIRPILMSKGNSKLALYGLSHVKDERLARLFINKKVSIECHTDQEDWFNLLVLHQNRATRGVKNFIPESVLPQFMNLIIWGHEHDCKIIPTASHSNTYISQPGSSVATSLCEGESLEKNVGLLMVHKDGFSMTPIALQTVRPFIFDDIVLPDIDDIDEDITSLSDHAMQVVVKKVEEMIDIANQMKRYKKMLPLIRLNVKYKDERQTFNTIRFGQKFEGKVANPEDIIKCAPYKKVVTKRQNTNFDGEEFDNVSEWANNVEDIVLKHFDQKNHTKVLPVVGLTEALSKFIQANDGTAALDYIAATEKAVLKRCMEELPADIDDFLNKLDEERKVLNKDGEEAQRILNDPNRNKKNQQINSDEEISLDDSDDELNSTAKDAKKKTATARGGRGSRGGKGSRGPRGSRRGKVAN